LKLFKNLNLSVLELGLELGWGIWCRVEGWWCRKIQERSYHQSNGQKNSCWVRDRAFEPVYFILLVI